MKAYIALLFFSVLILTTSAEYTEEDGVVVLTDANFDEAIKQNEFILVKFYAPWCQHCKKMAPEYARAAKTLKNREKPIILAHVDATENKELSQRYNVEGFPTLKFFVNGEAKEYTGGRVEKDIVNWVLKMSGNVTLLIQSKEQFDTYAKENKVVVIYHGESEQDEKFKVFKGVAMSNNKISFGHVFDSKLAGELKLQSLGKISLFKQFDEGRNDFAEDAYTAETLQEFLSANSYATVMEFDDSAIEKIFQQGNPTIFLFHGSDEASIAASKIFTESAKALKSLGKVLFCVSRPDDGHGHFQRLADYVGVNTAKIPALMLITTAGELAKFKYDKEITKENIEKFVHDFINNKLEKYLKSEEDPGDQSGKPDKVAVGKTFDREILNNNKDILVKFYAPWCSHCKALQPKWESAAEKLKVNPNLAFYSVDATANEVPSVKIQGFPTIKYFPGNGKDTPIEFDGDRTEEGIIKFMKEHTTHPWVEVKDDL